MLQDCLLNKSTNRVRKINQLLRFCFDGLGHGDSLLIGQYAVGVVTTAGHLTGSVNIFKLEPQLKSNII